jgi:hypothetical protein
MKKSRISPIRWYIEHRLEYLENKQKKLKTIAQGDHPEQVETSQIDALLQYVENKGRIRELKHIIRHMEEKGEDW